VFRDKIVEMSYMPFGDGPRLEIKRLSLKIIQIELKSSRSKKTTYVRYFTQRNALKDIYPVQFSICAVG
jgi:hypothetical protein